MTDQINMYDPYSIEFTFLILQHKLVFDKFDIKEFFVLFKKLEFIRAQNTVY